MMVRQFMYVYRDRRRSVECNGVYMLQCNGSHKFANYLNIENFIYIF